MHGVGIACIYVNHQEGEDQTPAKLLAGVWQQLVLDKDVGASANRLYKEHHGKGTSPSIQEVFEVLNSSIRVFAQVYIVVDAVDEYPENQQTVLFKYLGSMEPIVNLMITSRPHVQPSSLPNPDTLEIRATDTDVRTYVKARIKNSSRLQRILDNRPDLTEDIHSTIIRNIKGM